VCWIFAGYDAKVAMVPNRTRLRPGIKRKWSSIYSDRHFLRFMEQGWSFEMLAIATRRKAVRITCGFPNKSATTVFAHFPRRMRYYSDITRRYGDECLHYYLGELDSVYLKSVVPQG
jgi:hypothetical protein